MLKLKALSLKQKIFLEKQKLNPEEYMLERKDHESYTFYHVPTKQLLKPIRR